MKRPVDAVGDIPAIVSGMVYGFVMFAAGFPLGVIRITMLVPLVGELNAVLIEIPFMLLICWYLSKQCLVRLYLALRDERRNNVNTMGVAAFSTLLLLESFLSLTLLDRTLGELLEDFTSAKGSTGLLAQIVTSSFPIIQMSKQVERKRNEKEHSHMQ